MVETSANVWKTNSFEYIDNDEGRTNGGKKEGKTKLLSISLHLFGMELVCVKLPTFIYIMHRHNDEYWHEYQKKIIYR